MPDQLIEDPVLRYRVRLSRQDEVLRAQIWADPGGGGTVEHFHPRFEERFEPGVRHAFQNTGQGVAHLVAEIEPALNMQDYFEEVMALARAGKYSRRGIPKGLRAALELAELQDRYRDTTVITSPPPALQRMLLPPLARLERWRRRRAGR